MTAVQQYLLVLEKDASEAIVIAEQSARQIESKEIKLVELVQSLGEYLVDDDKTIRAKAISFLSAVLAALSPKTLTRQQVEVIRQFLCDRIEDASGLKETATGLSALQQMSRFSGDDAIKVTTTLFADAQDLLQHPQSTRFVVYKLVDSLLSDQRPSLKTMGDDFVIGFTDLVSGEKDPRNLMMIFSMLKVLIVEWDITNTTNILFDAAFCYFPITFRPPPDDPYGITAQDLKLRLRDCLAASDHFGGLIFPALLDKIDSNSANVKRDVLQTMTACILAFQPVTVANFHIQIWDIVKLEVMSPPEEDMADEALHVVKALATALSKDPHASQETSPLTKYIKMVTNEGNEHFQEPQQRQAKPASRLVEAAACGSELAFSLVVKNVLPPAFTIYQAADSQSKRRALIEILNKILDASAEVNSSTGHENPLLRFKDTIFDTLSQALMGSPKDHISLRNVSLQGLLKLCKLRYLLSNNEIGIVVQHLDSVVLTEKSTELRTAALDALVEISKLKPDQIMDIAFPEFLSRLPEAENASQTDFKPTLEALARMSVEKDIAALLVRRLISRLDSILQSQDPPLAYISNILATVLYVISNRENWSNVEIEAFYTQTSLPLINKVIKPITLLEDSEPLNSPDCLTLIGRITQVIIRSMGVERQTEILDAMFQLYMKGGPSDFMAEDLHPERFKPFLYASGRQGDTIILFAYVLAAVRRDIPLAIDKSAFLAFAVQTCKSCQRISSTQALLRLVAIISNKWFSKDDSEFIADLTSSLIETIHLENASLELKMNCLRALFWIAKSLVLRMDPLSGSVMENLIEQLAMPNELGRAAARGFSLLISIDEFLSKENHAVIRLLHKQRLFNTVVPQLAAVFHTATPDSKSNYLIALSGILKDVSSDIIIPSLENLLPLLLQSLSLDEVDVRIATIQTLKVIVAENADAAESHASTLVSKLLGCTVACDKNPPNIRQAALQCLKIIPSTMRLEILLPLRYTTLNALLIPLDDPKRYVRKDAVDSRAKWFTLDDPNAE